MFKMEVNRTPGRGPNRRQIPQLPSARVIDRLKIWIAVQTVQPFNQASTNALARTRKHQSQRRVPKAGFHHGANRRADAKLKFGEDGGMSMLQEMPGGMRDSSYAERRRADRLRLPVRPRVIQARGGR